MKKIEEVRRDLHFALVIRDAARVDVRTATAELQEYWLRTLCDAESEVARLQADLNSLEHSQRASS